ncbi:MAG TPA: C4-type zinc ribbon domain-containing protein [Candidatus Methanoperedens sp.]|nr:C4-type zinc ribbon domain-containing protein [Candidatus Methanoperedens sp.]
MYDQLEKLIRLQELDREAARLGQKLAEIAPQIEETRAHLAAAERALAEGKAEVETSRKERRAAEKDLEVQVDKRRKFQEQQSKVKTNKEYQALMHELEALKSEETAAEDKILALMEQQAEAERVLPALTAEVAREKTEFQEKERALRAAEALLRDELATAERAREAVVVTLEPPSLQAYQRIQKLRGNVVVVEARDEFCLGCRTKLPPQQFMEAMSNSTLKTCPHCHRILFYVRPETGPAPAAGDALADAGPAA